MKLWDTVALNTQLTMFVDGSGGLGCRLTLISSAIHARTANSRRPLTTSHMACYSRYRYPLGLGIYRYGLCRSIPGIERIQLLMGCDMPIVKHGTLDTNMYYDNSY